MPSFEVAYIREQGQSVVIVPLADEFEDQSSSVQREIIKELEARARAAGLDGPVAPIWEADGCTKFIAPAPWHAFLKKLSWSWVAMHVNRKISW